MERLGIGEGIVAGHLLCQQPAAGGAERQAVMGVAEIKPEAAMAWRWTDHRPHVGQAWPQTEPGRRLHRLAEREQSAGMNLVAA